MELKINTETVRTVDYGDLDAFLTERFGFVDEHYEFIAAEEMSNDSSKIINVDKKEFSKWDKKDLERALTTKKWECHDTWLLLCYLCKLGEIPEGKYVIEVSW